MVRRITLENTDIENTDIENINRPQVFLKFNRFEISSQLCLIQWIEIFKNYSITIVCDLFNSSLGESFPDYLTKIVEGKNINIINTDYNLGKKYTPGFKARKRKQSSANLTCFEMSKNLPYYWLIDADDTMFLTRDLEYVALKLKEAEDILVSEELDGFSLDFYREICHDHWSFGVCVLKGNIPFEQILKISPDELESYPGLTKNLDSYFDILRRKGSLKLKSFVINEMAFQHQLSPFNTVPNGIYLWVDNKLWQYPLAEDIVIL